MPDKLRALIVEDDADDAELLLRELRRGGYKVSALRVETAQEMEAALRDQTWHIVFSDFTLPQFSALAALKVVRKLKLDIPFIILSGTVGEETAVDAMRSGAHDFMAKGRFSRLLPAVERELREAAGRAERAQIERQLRQAQKMEAIGLLTGGIAHDFNNILGGLVSCLDLAEQRVWDDDETRGLIGEAIAAAMHAAELTRRLLAFARQQPLVPRSIAVNELVAGMSTLLRRALGEAVTVLAAPAVGVWPAVVDPTQLEDALLNLSINARDAMPEGGTLTIETANVSLDDAYAVENPGVAAGDYVLIAVSDTGTGMPASVIERAFEPFFTTKGNGRGSGLGLSMVYGFAKQSGGHVRICSEPGQGTTVKLYLPRSAEDAVTRVPPAAVSVTPRGSETILLVEDNTNLRVAAQRILGNLGYRVLAAENAAAALAIVDAGEPIDLLFTDMVMPGGLSGQDLANAARKRLPNLPVVFTTGYAGDSMGGGPVAAPSDILITKPYRRQELALSLRAALAERKAGPAA